VAIYLNNNFIAITDSAISTNTFYNVIVYRNSVGVLQGYLNKAIQTPATFTNAINAIEFCRIACRISNAGGTTHVGYFGGGIQTLSIYQAPSLDINKILRVEGNVSKEYTGVA
jgi:hypothetical protein